MEKYVYTVLYRKEILETNKFLLIPCYVIKGRYDKKERLFLDELNKSRFFYTDINIINEQCSYCIGEVYTEEELRKKFPTANSLGDLKVKLFEEQEKKVTMGYYDSTSQKIEIMSVADLKENNLKKQVETISEISYYEKMKQPSF